MYLFAQSGCFTHLLFQTLAPTHVHVFCFVCCADKPKVDTTASSDTSTTEPADSASKPAPPKPVTPAPPPEPDLSSYSWCSSHRSLLLTLSYIIQTIALKCTSALVALPSKQSLPSSLQGKTGTKTFKPLEVLPVALPDLPPLQDANREKVL